MGKDDILVFCAHSDDEIIGPGGTLARYAKEGKKVHTIIFSYGEGLHPHLRKEVVKEMRGDEAVEADKIIGGKGVIFLGLKDGIILKESKDPKVKERILKILKKYKPTKVLTHTKEDPHHDHKAVNKIILEVVEENNLTCEVYGFEIWTFLKLNRRHYPKLLVDISDSFSVKLEALKCFRSQKAAMIMLKWSVYTKAIINGFQNDTKFAEVFYRLK